MKKYNLLIFSIFHTFLISTSSCFAYKALPTIEQASGWAVDRETGKLPKKDTWQELNGHYQTPGVSPLHRAIIKGDLDSFNCILANNLTEWDRYKHQIMPQDLRNFYSSTADLSPAAYFAHILLQNHLRNSFNNRAILARKIQENQSLQFKNDLLPAGITINDVIFSLVTNSRVSASYFEFLIKEMQVPFNEKNKNIKVISKGKTILLNLVEALVFKSFLHVPRLQAVASKRKFLHLIHKKIVICLQNGYTPTIAANATHYNSFNALLSLLEKTPVQSYPLLTSFTCDVIQALKHYGGVPRNITVYNPEFLTDLNQDLQEKVVAALNHRCDDCKLPKWKD